MRVTSVRCLGQILTAGERGDRRAVATRVHLPLLVHASGFRIRIDTTADVLCHSAARGAPETLAFRTGEPPAIRRGMLARDETETFLLYVSTGQRLSVRVTEVAGRDVIVKVYEHATGTPLDERAGIGGRVWNGRVRFTGTARIAAIRGQPGGAPLSYSLVVDLR
jgi:hypothetical protein